MKKSKIFSVFLYTFYFSALILSEHSTFFTLVSITFMMISFFFFMKGKTLSVPEVILGLIILSIPLSFKNIFGLPYGDFPLSWYNLFVFILIVYILLYSLVRVNFSFDEISIISLLVLICLFVPLLSSKDFINGAEQFLNIALFFGFFLLIRNLNLSEISVQRMMILYKDVTLAISITVILQGLLFNKGYEIGNVVIYGGDRYAIGYLFSDFSFLSLYIASGIVILWILRAVTKLWIPEIIVLIAGSLMTTARTGMTAVLIILVLYVLLFFVKNIQRKPFTVVSMTGSSIAVLFSIYSFMKILRPSDSLSSSGRLEGYFDSLSLLKGNMISGVGLGVQTFNEFSNVTIPHNLFIQVLVQGGGVFFTVIVLFFVLMASKLIQNRNSYFGLYAFLLIGAQFIPDILNSRFFLILVSLIYISNFPRHSNYKYLPSTTM